MKQIFRKGIAYQFILKFMSLFLLFFALINLLNMKSMMLDYLEFDLDQG